jgi:hypothetical protein
METSSTFEIILSDMTMVVTSHIVASDEVFRIEFSDGRPALVVHEALGGNRPFWTSIPRAARKKLNFLVQELQSI